MAAAKNGRTKADEQPTVITPKVIIDTENREWQPMNSSMDSIQPEIVTDAPTSPVNPSEVGLAVYNPDFAELDDLVNFVTQVAEQTEVEAMIIDHNLEQVQQEGEQLQLVHQKLQEIKRNQQKVKLGSTQLNAKQKFNDLVKKQVQNFRKGMS